MSAASASRAWSWRHAVARSGLPATTRHLLLTVSIFMDEAGGSCFPSIEDLIETTGLGRTAVIKHLGLAVESGWLRRGQHGFRGRRWRRSEYEPCWPGRDVEPGRALGEMTAGSDGAGAAVAGGGGARASVAKSDGAADANEAKDARGGSRREPPRGDEAVRLADGGGSPRDTEVVREVNHVIDQSRDHSKTSPVEREGARGRGRERVPNSGAPKPTPETDERFQELSKRYPAVNATSRCYPLWLRLDDEGRRRALARLEATIAAERQSGRTHMRSLETYLRDRLFDQVDEPADGKPVLTAVPARSRDWWALIFRHLRRGKVPRFAWDMARQSGTSMTAPLADLPDEAERAALVAIETGGEAFAAWQRHLEGQGLRMRADETHLCGKFIYVPSEFPPGWPGPSADGAGADARGAPGQAAEAVARMAEKTG